VANDLIQVNQNRIHKDLITDNNQGDKPIFYLANTRQEEAEYVCNKITQLVNNKQCQHKDIGVLYRSNYLSRFIEQELVNQSIPYRIYGGVKFFQRLEIKDLLAYLKLIVDPCNEIALRRIINVPKRGIGRTTTDRIDAYATKNKVSFAYALNLSEQDLDLPWSINPIRKFLYTLKTLREKQTTLSISETVEAIIQSIEYDKYLQSLDFEDRISNIEELIGAIKEYELQNPQAKIVDYLQEISLYTDNEKNVKAKNDSVTLLTVHTAKGTEYHAVFVVGLNEGVFPSSKAEDLDEERRIGYVAITRAKHYLFLTCSQQDMTQQGNVYQATSRFINEINKSYLEYHQPDVVNDKHQYKYIDNTPTYVVGNVVKHAIFGVGIVVGVRGHLINVSFKAPYGIKTLVKNHHALRQIKN
jgi:DNA helicase-2/ATP-dependent DNA helicase PcrA